MQQAPTTPRGQAPPTISTNAPIRGGKSYFEENN